MSEHPSTTPSSNVSPSSHKVFHGADSYQQLFKTLLKHFETEAHIETACEKLTNVINPIKQAKSKTSANKNSFVYTISGLEGFSRALFLKTFYQNFLSHVQLPFPIAILAVTDSESESKILHDDLTLLEQHISPDISSHSSAALTWYPMWSEANVSDELNHAETRLAYYKRIRTEFLLRSHLLETGHESIPAVIVSTSTAALSSCRVRDPLQMPVLNLKAGATLNREKFLTQLEEWGYRRESYANQVGEFAYRGEVFEIFTPDYPTPLRCYFFGDEVEALKLMPDAQMESSTLKSLSVATLSPFFIENSSNQVNNPDDLITLTQYNQVCERGVLELHFKNINNAAAKNHFHFPILPAQRFQKNLEQTQNVISRLLKKSKPLYIFTSNPLLIKTLVNVFDKFELRLILKKDFINSSQAVEEKTVPTKKQISSHFSEKAPRITLVEAKISGGFAGTQLYAFTGEEIFGKRLAGKENWNPTAPDNFWETFLELEQDDFVVHIHHGIGLYRGIERIRIDDREKDYLKIEYKDQAKIFIPVEQLHLVQKYIGERNQVQINTLGKNNWHKTTTRAQKEAEKVAKKLLVLYSKRNSLRVSPLPKEEYFQQLFEMEFPYAESSGQLKCSEEIKNDLEKDVPMDRLLCADVGYGKTEVALRAVFKTALSGRQCLFLVPTTLLSIQHYETFIKRFKNTSFNIALLNRFTSQKEFTTILEKIRSGKLEILVGTHKALTKKIKFHKLGLLVIDEEQKFGVAQKEAIRESYPAVHTLSLSATPIPRTLHLSLSALRDLSFISTPITGRLPVITAVMEFDESVVKKAFKREKARGGQCYFIYNRVQSLPLFEKTLKNIIPEAKILSLHAQMEREVIEDHFQAFRSGKYDVLLATSIVDSGLDISSVNTLFVYNAHMFGLAQLYQIKGRVGRSSVKAYGYFFYPKERTITENAYNRLHCLERYTELGSGYQIAIKDLELRGAGNLLGTEQSGTLALVGLELFSNLLKEAITKLKEGDKGIPVYYEPIVELSYKAYIPDAYASSQALKAALYRKIMTAKSLRQLEAVRKTFEAEHGTLPEIMSELFIVSAFKIFVKRHKVLSVIEKNEQVELKFLKVVELEPSELQRLIREETIQVRQEIPSDIEGGGKKSKLSQENGLTQLSKLAGLSLPEDKSAYVKTPQVKDAKSTQEGHRTILVFKLSKFKEEYEKTVPLTKKINLLKDLIGRLVLSKKKELSSSLVS